MNAPDPARDRYPRAFFEATLRPAVDGTLAVSSPPWWFDWGGLRVTVRYIDRAPFFYAPPQVKP